MTKKRIFFVSYGDEDWGETDLDCFGAGDEDEVTDLDDDFWD